MLREHDQPAAAKPAPATGRSTLTPTAGAADLRLHQLRPLYGVFRPPPQLPDNRELDRASAAAFAVIFSDKWR